MTNASYSKSNKRVKTKKTMTLADLRKIQRQNSSRLSLKNAYEIVGGYKEADDKLYALAMKIVENDDKEFALSLKKAALPGKRTSLKALISEYDAYEIAGGYMEADEETFQRALKIVAEKDKAFAEELRLARKAEEKALHAEFSAAPEEVSANADYIISLFEKDGKDQQLKQSVMEDNELKTAFANTSFYDTDLQTGKEVISDNEQNDKLQSMLYEQAKTDVWAEFVGSKEFSTADDKAKEEKVKSGLKSSLMRALTKLRTFSAFKVKEKEEIQALKEGNESFFKNRIGKIRDAFDFKKKVSVSGEAFRPVLDAAKKRFSSFAGKLAKATEASEEKSKKFFTKAAAYTQKLTVRLVAASMVVSSLFPSCSNSEKRARQENGGLRMPKTEYKAEKDTVASSKQADSTYVANITVLDISEKQKNNVRQYYGEFYATMYKNIPENLLTRDGVTISRDMFLNQLRGHAAFYGHKAEHDYVIEALRGPCDKDAKKITLTADDVAFVFDPIPEGTKQIRESRIDLDNCGEITPIIQQLNEKRPDDKPEEAAADTVQTAKVEFTDGGAIHTKMTVNKKDTVLVDAKIALTQGTDLQNNEEIGSVDGINGIKVKDQKVTVENNNNSKKETVLRSGGDQALFNNEATSNSAVKFEQGDEAVTTVLASDFAITQGTAIANKEIIGKKDSTVVNDVKVQDTSIMVESTSASNANAALRSGGDQNLFDDIASNTASAPLQIRSDSIAIENTSDSNANATLRSGGDQSLFDDVFDDTTSSTAAPMFEVGDEAITLASDTTNHFRTENVSVSAKDTVWVSDLESDRGGYNGYGIDKGQYKKLKKFFKIKDDEAFEIYKAKITEEMMAKGGIFEGLNETQSLFAVKQIVEWSDNKVGAFKNEINTLTAYFNDCIETIPAEQVAGIKALVDRVNIDGTIDGVIGKECVQTLNYVFNDCGEKGTHIRQNVDCADKPTQPGDKKWPRMLAARLIRPTSIFEDGEEIYTRETVTKNVTEIVDAKIVYTQGTNLRNNEAISEKVNPEMATTGVSPKDVALTVETSFEQRATAASKRIKEKKSKKKNQQPESIQTAKKLTAEAQADLRKRGIDPTKVNPNLCDYINSNVHN